MPSLVELDGRDRVHPALIHAEHGRVCRLAYKPSGPRLIAIVQRLSGGKCALSSVSQHLIDIWCNNHAILALRVAPLSSNGMIEAVNDIDTLEAEGINQ